MTNAPLCLAHIDWRPGPATPECRPREDRWEIPAAGTTPRPARPVSFSARLEADSILYAMEDLWEVAVAIQVKCSRGQWTGDALRDAHERYDRIESDPFR